MNKKSKNQKGGAKLLLSPEEELLLLDWLNRNGQRGYPRRRKDIIDNAFYLLQRRGGDSIAKRPGRKWFYGFMKRNKLSFRVSEPISKAAACLTRSDIESWFDKVYKYISGHENPGDKDFREALEDPSRCYNADESFFY